MDTTSRILIVEDDCSVSDLICDTLATDYSVDSVRHPREALDLIRQHHFDLVILDLGLPEMDGVEVIRRIRSDPTTAGTSILVMSAFNDLRRRVPAEQVSGLLAKPFSLSELADNVSRILGQSGAGGSASVSPAGI